MFELSASLKLHQPNHVVIGKARKEHRKALAAQVNGVHFKRNMGWFLPGSSPETKGYGYLSHLLNQH